MTVAVPRTTLDGLPVVEPDWLDELRLDPGPPYQTMGTRALDPAHWLVADARRDGELARKRALLAEAPSVVAGALPSARDAAEEALGLVAAFTGLDPRTDPSAVLDGLPCAHDVALAPLARAALLVQDDLALMEQIDGEWVLSAAVVCFPSHWNPGDKLGLPLGLVHSPVAHYERELAGKVDRFHDRLATDRPAWRRNWSVNTTSELHLADRGVQPPAPERVAADGTPMWIRSERQTLRRLAATGAVLFTIRVQLAPLGVLLDRPDIARRMLTCVESWDDAKRAYNSTGGALDQLIAWLRDVASTS